MNYRIVARVADYLPEEVEEAGLKHFASCQWIGIKRYCNVINTPQGVYGFITAQGELHYLTEKRWPYETTDIVYILECHS